MHLAAGSPTPQSEPTEALPTEPAPRLEAVGEMPQAEATAETSPEPAVPSLPPETHLVEPAPDTSAAPAPVVEPTETRAQEEEQPAPTPDGKEVEPAEARVAGQGEPAQAGAAETEAPPAAPAGPRLAELRPGMVMEGTVTRIERYGAFVNLGLVEKRDGLIHISELAPYRVRRVEDVVQVGTPVRARVVSVDLARGRISLSLNDVPADTISEAANVPTEPTLTSMALAFERAYGRQRDRERREEPQQDREDVGARKRREHEMLMRRLRSDRQIDSPPAATQPNR